MTVSASPRIRTDLPTVAGRTPGNSVQPDLDFATDADAAVDVDLDLDALKLAAHQSRRSRILLVDDDPGVRSSLGAIFTDEGYVVLPARDGQEALSLGATMPFDLVLLDLNMPVKNGWETFERLSRDHPTVPVIIITARPHQLFTALGAGVGALLEKPLEIPVLLHTVERLLSEPSETRLARLAGKVVDFCYSPAKPAS